MVRATEEINRTRLGTLLRRQQAVRRSGDMFWTLAAVAIVLVVFMVIMAASEETAIWVRGIAIIVAIVALAASWRLARAALAMGRWLRDPQRLTAMAGTEEIPGIGDALGGHTTHAD